MEAKVKNRGEKRKRDESDDALNRETLVSPKLVNEQGMDFSLAP